MMSIKCQPLETWAAAQQVFSHCHIVFLACQERPRPRKSFSRFAPERLSFLFIPRTSPGGTNNSAGFDNEGAGNNLQVLHI